MARIDEIRGYGSDNIIIYLAGKNTGDAPGLGHADLVTAGDGDGDQLTGGAGADTFIFHFGDGADTSPTILVIVELYWIGDLGARITISTLHSPSTIA